MTSESNETSFSTRDSGGHAGKKVMGVEGLWREKEKEKEVDLIVIETALIQGSNSKDTELIGVSLVVVTTRVLQNKHQNGCTRVLQGRF